MNIESYDILKLLKEGNLSRSELNDNIFGVAEERLEYVVALHKERKTPV